MGSNACNPLSQTMLSGIIWFRQGDGKQGDSGMVNGSATNVAELERCFTQPRYTANIMTVVLVLLRKLKPGENRSTMAMRCKAIVEVETLPANLQMLLVQQADPAEKEAKQAEQHEAGQAGDTTPERPRKKPRKA